MTKDRKWLSADMCRAESTFCGAAIAFRDGGCMYEELLHKAEGMIEVAVAEALREEAELYHSADAEATGPERDLEKLEWLVGKSKTTEAKKEWLDKGRQWLAVTWDGGQYSYFTRDGERTRAEALALLKEAK